MERKDERNYNGASNMNRLGHCALTQYAHRIEDSMDRSKKTYEILDEVAGKVKQLDRIPEIVTAVNRASWSNIILTIGVVALLVLRELRDSNTNLKAGGFGANVEVIQGK